MLVCVRCINPLVLSRSGTWRRWRIFTSKTLSKGHAVGLAGWTSFKVTKVKFVELWDVRKIAGRTRYLNEISDHIDHFPRIRVRKVSILDERFAWIGCALKRCKSFDTCCEGFDLKSTRLQNHEMNLRYICIYCILSMLEN